MGGTVVPTYLAPDQGWTPPDATPVAAPVAPSAAAVAPLATPQPQMDPNAASTIEQQPISYNNLPTDDAANHALAVHHGRLASMLDAVGGILGGNKSLRMTRNADGSVDVKQVDASPGEKWGRVAQAALTGLANGFAVGQGPGGAARAAAAGIQTGLAEPGQQQNAVLDQAQKLNQQNQQKKLFDANMALMDQKIASGAFDQKTKPIEWAQTQQARNLDMTQKLRNDYSARLVGHAKNMEDVANIVNANPDAVAAHAGQNDGIVYPMTHYAADGTADGMDVWLIPPDYAKRLNDKPMTIAKTTLNPDDPTKVLHGEVSIPAYSMRGQDYFGAQKAYDLQNANVANIAQDNANAAAQTGIKQQMVPFEIKKTQAEIAKDTAEAANAGTGAKGTLVPMEDASGNTVLVNNKSGAISAPSQPLAKMGTSARNAAAVEKQIGPARDGVNYANNYLASGQFTGPSDEALQEKFFEVTKPTTGFRMNDSVIKQLNNSRNMMGSAEVAGRRAIGGSVWFSNKQRQDIVDTMNAVAKAKGINIAGPANQIIVHDPNGNPHPFATQAEADQFKKLAGIQQ